MRWLLLSLSGPLLWAAVFSLVYGLHGTACAGVSGPEGLGTSARLLLIAAWGVGLAGHAALVWHLSQRSDATAALPRAGAWIGLWATLFTLFPVLIITSC